MNASWISTGLLMLAWTSPLAAQSTARLALTWNTPPGCPTTEDVQARINALLGGEASRVADVRASGQVEREESGFRLLLNMEVAGAPSSRVIEARTCDELAGAAAIAIALLARSTLNSSAATSGEVPPTPTSASGTSNEASAPTPSPTPPVKPSANRTTQSASAAVHLVIDAPIGLAGWGSMPSVELGLGAAVGLRWKSLRAVARGELWTPQDHDVSGFAAHFSLLSARAEACLVQRLGDLELGPCLGGGVQRLTGEGIASEVFSPGSRTTLWASGLGGVFASLPTPGFAPLRFFGEASVLVSPLRPRFVIDQLGPTHEPALAAPRLDLGCEWIF